LSCIRTGGADISTDFPTLDGEVHLHLPRDRCSGESSNSRSFGGEPLKEKPVNIRYKVAAGPAVRLRLTRVAANLGPAILQPLAPLKRTSLACFEEYALEVLEREFLQSVRTMVTFLRSQSSTVHFIVENFWTPLAIVKGSLR
jgi:hypothetical protein